MEYQQFKDEIIAAMKYAAERKLGGSIEVSRGPKGNSIMDIMTFRQEDSPMGIAMYPEHMYQEYLAGRSIMEIVAASSQYIEAGKREAGEMMQAAIDNFKIENVFPVLLPRNGNEEYLSVIPHIPFEDLAIKFCIRVSQREDEIATMTITEPHLEQFGVTIEELHDIALVNPAFREDIVIHDLDHVVMGEMLGNAEPVDIRSMAADDFQQGDRGMLVISNKDKSMGAAAILDKEALKAAADLFQADLYVLPSSIHECILVSSDCPVSTDELREMVQEINETQVEPEERLSDEIYFFDRKTLDLKMESGERAHIPKIAMPERDGR